MRVLVTGADGFLGKNLCVSLAEREGVEVLRLTRANSDAELRSFLREADYVFHLAGVNRPRNPDDFITGNLRLTEQLCGAIKDIGRMTPVVYASSIQAAADNRYGQSKRAAEEALFDMRAAAGVPVHVFRLPNVFGKWCKPNYNSAVATFCYNIARDLPIQVNDANATLRLVYVDDLIERFVRLMIWKDENLDASGFETVTPQYTTTVGEVADQIRAFRASRSTLVTERVGCGLTRALYSTYMSYLPTAAFTYEVPQHCDSRGSFVEMIKTPDCGQVSYFTAYPGVTRGGHYHHTKSEKFLVIRGRASFRFRHLQSGEFYERITTGNQPEIVETIPGWAHDVTNIGTEDMIVMLWANEMFDRLKPDTHICPL